MSDFTFIALAIILYKLVAEPFFTGYKKKQNAVRKNESTKKDNPQQKAPEAPGDYVDYEEVK